MSVAIIAQAVATTGLYSAKTVIDSVRGRLTLERGDEIVRTWSRNLLRQVDVTLRIRGLGNIGNGATYVLMSNHQSLYDIPTVITAIPLTVRMMAKAELFSVPLWSQAMKAAGFVPVHRGDRAKALQDIRAAQEAIGRGINIWVAPEGTRSPDGQLLPFKSGGFLLATATKTPILPITIDGTRRVLPARELRFTRGIEVTVTIGKPIDPRQFLRKDKSRLLEVVRSSIEDGFKLPKGSTDEGEVVTYKV